MRRSILLLASALLVTSMLSGCIVVPWDDGGYRGGYGGYDGGYHHHHHGWDHGYHDRY